MARIELEITGNIKGLQEALGGAVAALNAFEKASNSSTSEASEGLEKANNTAKKVERTFTLLSKAPFSFGVNGAKAANQVAVALDQTGKQAQGLEQGAKKATAATNGLSKATGMSKAQIEAWDAAARRNQMEMYDRNLRRTTISTRQQATETAKATVEVNKSTDSLIRHTYAQRAALSASNNLAHSFSGIAAGGRGVASNVGIAVRQLATLSTVGIGATGGMQALAGAFLGPGGVIIGISAAVTALIGYIGRQKEAKDSTEALATSTSVLHHTFAGNDYKTAVKNISELKTNIDLARDGLISKRDVVNQYNKAIGDVTGKLNTFSQVEKFITDNSDAYIKAMLLRSAATLALERAAEEAFKAQQALNRTDEEAVSYFQSGLANSNDPKVMELYRRNAERNRQTIASEHQKDQAKFEQIASDLQKQAAELAKQFNFNLFGEASKGGASEAAKSLSKLNDTLDKLRQESIQASLSGYEKELQASSHKYNELRKQAEQYYRDGKIQAKDYTNYLIRLAGFEIAERGRIVPGARPAGLVSPASRGAGITGDMIRSQATVIQFQPGDSDEYWSNVVDQLDKQLGRAVHSFGRDFLRTLTTINQQADVTFGGVVSGLIGSLTGGLTEVMSTVFTKQLGEAIQGAFGSEGLGSKGTYGAAGAAILGSIISGSTKRTSTGGQALGGALAGAGTGAAIGSVVPGIGTAIGAAAGAIIGALGGILGASSAKKSEKQQDAMLAEQRKQTALLERQNALAYASSIMGQMTAGGVVTGIMRDAFGQLVATVRGDQLEFVLQRARASR